MNMSALFRIFCIGLAFCFCSCAKIAPTPLAVSEMLRIYGTPVVIASGFAENQNDSLVTVTLYGINKPVSADGVAHLKPGQIVVYCNDSRFLREIGFHFDDMYHHPEQFTGSSMFAALFKYSTSMKIFQVEENGKVELLFSNYVAIVYLEMGDKGHLIRTIEPKHKPADQ